MRKELHELTRTHRKTVIPGTLREHLGRDVKDIKTILQNAGYDTATVNVQLKELIRQNKAMGGFVR